MRSVLKGLGAISKRGGILFCFFPKVLFYFLVQYKSTHMCSLESLI